jgi:hypothetical protein
MDMVGDIADRRRPEAGILPRASAAGGALALAAVALGLGAGAPVAAATTRIYVSPGGNDLNPGTRARPFRSPRRARDAVRRLNAHMTDDIEVRLLAGTYRLPFALRLGPQDSGRHGHRVVWMSQPGRTATISGGVPVRGWTLFDAGRGIWRARVSPILDSRQLYVDGQRVTRARSAAPPAGAVKTAVGYDVPSATGPGVLAYQAGMEVVSNWGWKSFRCPVASVRAGPVTTSLVMAQPCWHNANVFAPLFRMNDPSWIENSYQLIGPAEWYLDRAGGWLYYEPPASVDPRRADVELPVAQGLVVAEGTPRHPIHDLAFEGLTFAYATWLAPSSGVGYADDQTGLRVVAPHQLPASSHAQNTSPIPGNVRLAYARRVLFARDRFTHLGAAGLQLDTGSQANRVVASRFDDISAAAIVLGGVAVRDHHPRHPGQVTRDNQVVRNVVANVAREYLDSAGIFVGFTTRSLIAHNDLHDLPYDGISVGWGFGMMDPGRVPGVPGRFPGCFGCQSLPWPKYRTPTTSRGNRVLYNRVWNYLQTLYDGGAVYVLGQQGRRARDGMVIAGNLAFGKAPQHGGNVLYTDAGTRYVTIARNVTYDNAPGYYGPTPPFSAIQWGRDGGGCRPRGAIVWSGNWWQYPPAGGGPGSGLPYPDLDHPYPQNQLICHPPYCPLGERFVANHRIRGPGEVPRRVLVSAGAAAGAAKTRPRQTLSESQVRVLAAGATANTRAGNATAAAKIRCAHWP